jgi:hypothetical protein
LGGGLFMLLQKHDRMTPSAGWTLGTAVIGAAVGASVGARIEPRPSSIALQLGPAQDIQPLAQQTSNGSILTVDPSVTSQTIALNPSTPVLIYIPAGFHWVSVDGSPIADTTSPYQFTFLGAMTHTFVWVDSLNQQHTSVYNFVLLPQTQSVTA